MGIASWCKGSTSGFGPASLGSNPGGVTKNQRENERGKRSSKPNSHADFFLFILMLFLMIALKRLLV